MQITLGNLEGAKRIEAEVRRVFFTCYLINDPPSLHSRY